MCAQPGTTLLAGSQYQSAVQGNPIVGEEGQRLSEGVPVACGRPGEEGAHSADAWRGSRGGQSTVLALFALARRGWAQCPCGCGAMQAPRLTREEAQEEGGCPCFRSLQRSSVGGQLHSGPAPAPRPYARGHDADFAGRNSAVCCAQFLLLCRVRVGCAAPTHPLLRVERITAGVHAPLAHNTGRKAPAVKAQWR